MSFVKLKTGVVIACDTVIFLTGVVMACELVVLLTGVVVFFFFLRDVCVDLSPTSVVCTLVNSAVVKDTLQQTKCVKRFTKQSQYIIVTDMFNWVHQ